MGKGEAVSNCRFFVDALRAMVLWIMCGSTDMDALRAMVLWIMRGSTDMDALTGKRFLVGKEYR
jgi:hypothetical protein